MAATAERDVRICRIELEFAATLPTDELIADAAIEAIREAILATLGASPPLGVFDESFRIRSWDDVPEGQGIE